MAARAGAGGDGAAPGGDGRAASLSSRCRAASSPAPCDGARSTHAHRVQWSEDKIKADPLF